MLKVADRVTAKAKFCFKNQQFSLYPAPVASTYVRVGNLSQHDTINKCTEDHNGNKSVWLCCVILGISCYLCYICGLQCEFQMCNVNSK